MKTLLVLVIAAAVAMVYGYEIDPFVAFAVALGVALVAMKLGDYRER